LSQDRTAEHAAEYRQTLNQLKKDYITAYIASHSKARLGVAEDKTRNALRKDDRLLALRVLAGVSLMPTSQLTAFEESLNGLKSCSSLDEPTLMTAAVCPHCQFRPSAEQLELIPAANRLHKLDDDLDQLVANWQQTLLENLEDPFTQDSLGLLPPAIQEADRRLPDLTQAAGPDDHRVRQRGARSAVGAGEDRLSRAKRSSRRCCKAARPPHRTTCASASTRFMNDRCKGKDSTKLRFVIE
jgi:hypothetical protein